MSFFRTVFGKSDPAKAKDASPSKPVPKTGPEIMREMRLKWLDPKNCASSESVSAVLMDWPIGDTVATVCSSSAGDGSLYTTSTFGIIGGIGHEGVRKASCAFIRAAEKCLPLSAPTSDFDYSSPGRIKFYFVTASGIRGINFVLSEVEKEGTPARYLFAHGQMVLTELRLIGEGKPEVK